MRNKADIFSRLTEKIQAQRDLLQQHASEIPSGLYQGAIEGLDGMLAELSSQAHLTTPLQEHLIYKMADAIPDLLYLYDLQEERTLYINHAITSVMGYTSEHIQALGALLLSSFIHPEDLAEVARNIQRLEHTLEDEVVESVYRMRHADGSWRWLEGRDRVFTRNSDGTPHLMIGIAQDITERRRIEEAFRINQQRHQAILDQMPIVLFATDAQGVCTLWEGKGLQAIGLSPGELLGQSLLERFSARPRGRETMLAALGGKEATWEGEIQGKRIVEIRLTPIREGEGSGEGMIGLSLDVTERRQAEDRLRLYATWLQRLESFSRMLAVSQLELHSCLQRIAYYISHITNDICAIHLLGDRQCLQWMAFQDRDTMADHITPEWLPLVTEESSGRVLARERPLLVPALAEGLGPNLVPRELWLEEGPPPIHSLLVAPLIAQGKTIGTLALLRFIPDVPFAEEDQQQLQELAHRAAFPIQNAQLFEQIRADQERLQHLSRKLIEAQEQERRLIARELHDEVGQTLTAAKLNMEVLQSNDLPASAEPWVRESITILEKALQQLRTLSLELRPSLLDDLGLRSALLWYLMRQAERKQWQARLLMEPPSLSLPSQIETTCFRIVQEALTNTARHARANEVIVELYLEEEILHLTIKDDGIGFDVQAARTMALQGGSMGLLGMEERALLIGGELHLISAPGRGSLIRASFPVHGLDIG